MAVASELSYVALKTRRQPGIGGKWNSPDRTHAEELSLTYFCEDSEFRPQTDLKLLYDAQHLYGVFRVRDQYVYCAETEYQADVTRDASVAAYFQASPDGGYLAFEMNCCGTLRARYFEEPSVEKGALPGRIAQLPWKDGHQVRIYTSQFGAIESEIPEPMTWYLEFVIPFALFEKYTIVNRPLRDNPWRANFYKCASRCSHPHRASWSPLRDGVSFNQPESFAPLYFA
ncbi:MAG TPA: hypothetical protein ENN29_05865 [Candidatus Hydrogenedentes bacterium]|nr:hypothetical protein [Candidatus Hydrogenedentota bacterium]